MLMRVWVHAVGCWAMDVCGYENGVWGVSVRALGCGRVCVCVRVAKQPTDRPIHPPPTHRPTEPITRADDNQAINRVIVHALTPSRLALPWTVHRWLAD